MIDTKWKAFIELHKAFSDNGQIALLDVNRPVLIETSYDADTKESWTEINTPEGVICVTETPEQICQMVDEKIDAQVKAIAEENERHHAEMLEFHAKQEAEKEAFNK